MFSGWYDGALFREKWRARWQPATGRMAIFDARVRPIPQVLRKDRSSVLDYLGDAVRKGMSPVVRRYVKCDDGESWVYWWPDKMAVEKQFMLDADPSKKLKQYMARGDVQGQLLPGIHASFAVSLHCWDDEVYNVSEAEYMQASQGALTWEMARNGAIPASAIPMGMAASGEPIYTARLRRVTPPKTGMLLPNEKGCRVISNILDKNLYCFYEVLCLAARKVGKDEPEYLHFSPIKSSPKSPPSDAATQMPATSSQDPKEDLRPTKETQTEASKAKDDAGTIIAPHTLEELKKLLKTRALTSADLGGPSTSRDSMPPLSDSSSSDDSSASSSDSSSDDDRRKPRRANVADLLFENAPDIPEIRVDLAWSPRRQTAILKGIESFSKEIKEYMEHGLGLDLPDISGLDLPCTSSTSASGVVGRGEGCPSRSRFPCGGDVVLDDPWEQSVSSPSDSDDASPLYIPPERHNDDMSGLLNYLETAHEDALEDDDVEVEEDEVEVRVNNDDVERNRGVDNMLKMPQWRDVDSAALRALIQAGELVLGGRGSDTHELWVSRFSFGGHLLPDGHDRGDISCSDLLFLEVLVVPRGCPLIAEWVPASDGDIPACSFPSGLANDGEAAYVARAWHAGYLLPGRLLPSEGGCIVRDSVKMQMVLCKDYQVLTFH